MKAQVRPSTPWRLSSPFWLAHLWLPLVAVSVLLGIVEFTAVDLWVADLWYGLEGNEWSLRDHWLTYDLIHHCGKQLIIGFGLLLLGLLAASCRVERLAAWRRPLAYMLTCMLVLPALLTHGKHYSPVPCPWDIDRYGGEIAYQANFGFFAPFSQTGHCFPSGHASGAFALLAVYFAMLPLSRRPAPYLMPGLLLGAVFALGQQVRGAHFLSHDLWTLAGAWFGALALFLLFRPRRWPSSRRPGT